MAVWLVSTVLVNVQDAKQGSAQVLATKLVRCRPCDQERLMYLSVRLIKF